MKINTGLDIILIFLLLTCVFRKTKEENNDDSASEVRKSLDTVLI